LSRAFQWYVLRRLHTKNLGWFSTFSVWESNYLTLDLSFDHNLRFRLPNGWYEVILHIYVLIVFQWYKEFFEPMSFGPCNCVLKIWESISDSNSRNGSSLGSVRVHSLTLFALFALPRACDVTPGPPSWLATLQPPCLGHKPKGRVATTLLQFMVFLIVFYIKIYPESDECKKNYPINLDKSFWPCLVRLGSQIGLYHFD
jgi:hypothetical protein